VRNSWIALGSFLVFFMVYARVLYLQMKPEKSFEVERTIHEAVFSEESGMLDDNGRVTSRVSSGEDVYQLLENSLLPIYSHVTCGDGQCDDGERPWFGGQGCLSDCGTFPNVTRVEFKFVWYKQPPKSNRRRLAHLPDDSGHSNDPDSSTSTLTASTSIRVCEIIEGYCLPDTDTFVIVKGGKLNFTRNLFDGDWEIILSNPAANINGIVSSVTLDKNAMSIANATAWSFNATKEQKQYKYNLEEIYRKDELTTFYGCRKPEEQDYYNPAPLTLAACKGGDTEACTKTHEYLCAAGCYYVWLADGMCDTLCQNAACSFDNGDCCVQDSDFDKKLHFDLRRFSGGTNNSVLQKGSTGVFNHRTMPSEVYLGPDGTNRLLGGWLVTQTRRVRIACNKVEEFSKHIGSDHRVEYFQRQVSRFDHLARLCSQYEDSTDADIISKQISNKSYGFDPLYLPVSQLYNKEFADEISYLYPSKDAPAPAPAPAPASASETTAPAPASETAWTTRSATHLLRPKGITDTHQTPYAFSFEEALRPLGGFGIFFSNELSYAEVLKSIVYMRDGKFIDSNTESVEVRAMTYNADLNLFAELLVTFEFKTSGVIDVDAFIRSINVQPHRFYADLFQMLFEIAFFVMLCFNITMESIQLFSLCHCSCQHIGCRRCCSSNFPYKDNKEDKEGGGWIRPTWCDYFRSGWNYLDIFNLVLLMYNAIWWMHWGSSKSMEFLPQLSYNVYSPIAIQNNPNAKARWYSNANTNQLGRLVEDFTHLNEITLGMERYLQLQGISFLIMLMRCLKMLGFQHRISLVTDTLYEASGDLFHWAVIEVGVIVGFAFLGTLYLGHRVEAFSSFKESFLTCTIILMGEIGYLDDIGSDDITGQLFFWSYVFVNFFVLLNILLAIIVDSYAIVKERLNDEIKSMSTSASQNIVAELATLVKGGHGCSLPFTRNSQRRKELEHLVCQQLRAVLVDEEIVSNKLNAESLMAVRRHATLSRRVSSFSHDSTSLMQHHHKRLRRIMKVPTRAPSEEDEIGELIRENVLNKEILRDVLASGQEKMKESSEKMQDDVARLCEGFTTEDAKIFFRRKKGEEGNQGTESEDMLRYFGYLNADEE